MKLFRECTMCGTLHSMIITEEIEEGLDKYFDGEFIQDALPMLNPMEREFIKTGYCPECQEMLFGSEYTSELIDKED